MARCARILVKVLIHNLVIFLWKRMDSRIEGRGLWQIDAIRGAKVDLTAIIYIYYIDIYDYIE